MKRRLGLLITFVAFNAIHAFSQNTFPANGSTGIGTVNPSSSALLEVKSTTQGVLIPRMKKAQRDAIVSPATGLLIYQTNVTAGFYYYNGSSWHPISGAGANTTLSNLASGVAVNQGLTPDTDNSHDLGIGTMRWRDAYFGGTGFFNQGEFSSSLKIGNTAIANGSGTIRFNGDDFEGWDGTNWKSFTAGAVETDP